MVNKFNQFNRINTLPESFRKQICKIYEADKNAIICGSTALYLYGTIERLPNDIDVIGDHSKISVIGKLTEEEYPDKYEVKKKLEKWDEKFDEWAKKHKSVYTYLETVKYNMFGEGTKKLPQEVYDIAMAVWKKTGKKDEYVDGGKNESFEFKCSIQDIEKMCLFESANEVEYTTIDMDGLTIKLESLDTIIRFKKLYDRDKDRADLA